MARWRDYAPLTVLVGTHIYSGSVPQTAIGQPPIPYPRVLIATATEVPNNTFGQRGFENTLTAHAWAERTSTASAMDLALEVHEAMNGALEEGLVFNAESSAMLIPEFTTGFDEKDGDKQLYHVSVRYRASYLRTGAPV
jgi:hypothetical protein